MTHAGQQLRGGQLVFLSTLLSAWLGCTAASSLSEVDRDDAGLRTNPGADGGNSDSGTADEPAVEDDAGNDDAGVRSPAQDAGAQPPAVPGGPDESVAADPGPQPFLHPLFTDHMVLQRDALSPVWGWTNPGEDVSVELAGQTFKTQADRFGRWLVRVGPFSANAGPLELKVSGAQSLTLHDVQIGDVWLCSGQSNMVKILKEVIDGPAEVAASANAHIRLFRVDKANLKEPRQTLVQTSSARPKSWLVATPETTANFSAACYFMAKELQQRLQVPIGLITAAWGSTGIESWMSEAALSSFSDFHHDLQALKTQELIPTQPKVTTLYNAMIAPLQPFGLKGVAWYQGEYNSSRGAQYSRLLPALIEDMRRGFRMGLLPFLLVQLPNYINGRSWPFLREAQLHTRRTHPKTGMAVTIDVGNPEPVTDSIHPLNKQAVGYRLAKTALHVAYGQNGVHEGPLYKSSWVENSKIRIALDAVGSGLMVGLKRFDSLEPVKEVLHGTLEGFEIAGADRTTWVAASAHIDPTTNTILVSSPAESQPAAV